MDTFTRLKEAAIEYGRAMQEYWRHSELIPAEDIQYKCAYIEQAISLLERGWITDQEAIKLFWR